MVARFAEAAGGALSAGVLLVSGLSAQSGLPRGSWSQEWSGSSPAASWVQVRSAGRVVVRGTERDDVSYKLTTRARAFRGASEVPVVFKESGIVIKREGPDAVALVLRQPVCGDCRVSFVLEVEVPGQTPRIDIQTRGGEIDIRHLAGSVSAHAFGGSIAIDQIGGAVIATTAGGSVKLGTIAGAVDCETAGGSIELARAGGAASLVASVGSIRAQRVGGDLRAETGGGSIEIGRVDGMVRAKTGGGMIRVAEARNGMEAEARAGDIRIERALGTLLLSSGAGNIVAGLQEGATPGDSELSTSVGEIVLSLPDSLALTLEASIGLARGLRSIFSDFPSVQVQRPARGFGPRGEQAAGAINGGGSVVRILNGRGRIEIRRAQ